ncbi:MAG: transketolase C-terminal domain-containing protein [Candidatus Peribacteraceae bacterium]|nr:transketolase C-terminal domain-containing protein [Candidatus Peribacteraceae bacterium]
MPHSRPDPHTLVGQDPSVVPLSAQRILAAESQTPRIWIGPDEAKTLTSDETEAYDLAHKILMHLAIEAPRKHKSGHPGGPLSAFTFAYALLRRRDPQKDAALRMSAGHLSVLAYGLQYLGGRGIRDPRLASPQAIIDAFRVPDGLPGHVEAGIGDIPFGFGPLGKGMSNGLGHALGWKMLGKTGFTDVLIGDGDSQEGQVLEAARQASKLGTDRLVVHGDINDIQLSGIPSTVAASDIAAIFQSMGWAVVEVQNGNDPAQVEAGLDAADTLAGNGRPVFVCYYTTMGHGIPTMEAAANKGSAAFHGSPMKDPDAEKELKNLPPLAEVTQKYEKHRLRLQQRYEGAPPASTPLPPPAPVDRIITTEKGAARTDFGAVHLKNLMKADPRIVVLHGDLAGSGGFNVVEKEFPGRVINCGAAEANMYMMASGMRQAGFLPLTYTFAAFGTNEARANARLIDINAGHIPCSVLHDCTHAGLSVGEDGETHQDRNYLNIPFDRTQVWMPADSNQAGATAERAMQLVAEGEQSVYTFFARTGHEQLKTPEGHVLYGKDYVFDGKIDIVRGAGDVSDRATIIATGITVHDAVKAADRLLAEEKIQVRVLNVSCIRPLDASAILQAALETMHLIVVEDHHSEGGLASQVADVIADFQLPASLRRLGVNHYFPSGTAEDLKFLAGLDVDSIMDAVQDEVRSEVTGGEDIFVTAIFAFAANQKQSRFLESAKIFVDRLQTDPAYLDLLREIWRKRTVSPDRLPSNEQLRRRLAGDE